MLATIFADSIRALSATSIYDLRFAIYDLRFAGTARPGLKSGGLADRKSGFARPEKGGDCRVTRTASQADLALVLRRLSLQIEPKGTDASLASAPSSARPEPARRRRHRR